MVHWVYARVCSRIYDRLDFTLPLGVPLTLPYSTIDTHSVDMGSTKSWQIRVLRTSDKYKWRGSMLRYRGISEPELREKAEAAVHIITPSHA